MALAPQKLTPEIDAIFDEAQEKGVTVNFDGRCFVLLNEENFALLQKATNMPADMIKHVVVPRVDKPVTYALARETFDEYIDLHKSLVELINADQKKPRRH